MQLCYCFEKYISSSSSRFQELTEDLKKSVSKFRRPFKFDDKRNCQLKPEQIKRAYFKSFHSI